MKKVVQVEKLSFMIEPSFSSKDLKIPGISNRFKPNHRNLHSVDILRNRASELNEVNLRDL